MACLALSLDQASCLQNFIWAAMADKTCGLLTSLLCSLYEFYVCVLQQYWSADRGAYKYIPVTAFAEAFTQTAQATQSMQYLEAPYVAPNAKCDEALITRKYALSGGLLHGCSLLNWSLHQYVPKASSFIKPFNFLCQASRKTCWTVQWHC